MSTYQKAFNDLVSLFKTKGYLLHDNIIDIAIEYSVGIANTEKLMSDLLIQNALIYEQEPEESTEDDSDFSQLDYEIIFSDAIAIAPGLSQLVAYIREVIPPQHGEWRELILHAQSGNEYAYNRLFEMYLRTVLKIALDYYNRYEAPLEDCFQEGCIGLINAIEKFDNQSGRSFSGYFQLYVLAKMQREVELPNNPTVRLPVHYRDKVITAYDISMSHSCDYCPIEGICAGLLKEISLSLGCDDLESKQYLVSSFAAIEIEEYYRAHYNDLVDDTSLHIAIAGKINSEAISTALERLTKREKEVVKMRFGLYSDVIYTLEETGERFAVTRERIRQIEAKALRKLRHKSYGLIEAIFEM